MQPPRDPATPNSHGVYQGNVEIYDPVTDDWIRKRSLSTFFPDDMTVDEIAEAIWHAAERARSSRRSGLVVGPSGHGFEIEMRIAPNGEIKEAYPLYTP